MVMSSLANQARSWTWACSARRLEPVRGRLPWALPPPGPVHVLDLYWQRDRDRHGQHSICGLLHRRARGVVVLVSSSFWTVEGNLAFFHRGTPALWWDVPRPPPAALWDVPLCLL